jgi:hypothetical protein
MPIAVIFSVSSKAKITNNDALASKTFETLSFEEYMELDRLLGGQYQVLFPKSMVSFRQVCKKVIHPAPGWEVRRRALTDSRRMD